MLLAHLAACDLCTETNLPDEKTNSLLQHDSVLTHKKNNGAKKITLPFLPPALANFTYFESVSRIHFRLYWFSSTLFSVIIGDRPGTCDMAGINCVCETFGWLGEW